MRPKGSNGDTTAAVAGCMMLVVVAVILTTTVLFYVSAYKLAVYLGHPGWVGLAVALVVSMLISALAKGRQ